MTRYTKIAATIMALALTAVPAVAQAHNWVVLDAGKRTCKVPPAFAATPYQSEMSARAAGIFEGTNIMRDENGVVQAVAVKVLTSHNSKLALIYFRSLAFCQAGLAAIEAGTIKELN